MYFGNFGTDRFFGQSRSKIADHKAYGQKYDLQMIAATPYKSLPQMQNLK